ncbi:MAG: UbiA family prenyltransferase [Desulfamplus sp.]|nr:UbiA family prenyltransferase [Desulfamplus sp.]
MSKFKYLFYAILNYIQVSKIIIALGITLSTLLGYLLFSPYADKIFWITATASFLLSSGAGALNNYQDRNLDKLLKRTSKRPLPLGSISEKLVLSQAFILILSALTAFVFTHNPISTIFLALFGILFYNAIYTPLKSRTSLAILPGSVCGMIPPLMGWSAAGGELLFFLDVNNLMINRDIIFIMAILGIWQIPHFWLILLNYADDYEDSYVKYRLASMVGLFSRSQLKRIMLIWILLYSVMLIMTPIFYFGLSWITKFAVTSNGVCIFIFFVKSHVYTTKRDYRFEFRLLNSSMVLFILAMILDLLQL